MKNDAVRKHVEAAIDMLKRLPCSDVLLLDILRELWAAELELKK